MSNDIKIYKDAENAAEVFGISYGRGKEIFDFVVPMLGAGDHIGHAISALKKKFKRVDEFCFSVFILSHEIGRGREYLKNEAFRCSQTLN